jgi:5-methylcytosine-specific restriction endonuclease McrA
MREPKSCLHCGNVFQQDAGRGRDRQWCYDCLPRKQDSNGGYSSISSQLSIFARTGEHGGCCEPWERRKATRREPPHHVPHRSTYNVYPCSCLYCGAAISGPVVCCIACRSTHKIETGKRWRYSERGRAIRNANRNKRRQDKDTRYRLIARLLERDGTACGLCGLPTSIDGDDPTEVDHITPVNRGGRDDLDNLQLSHRSCNRSKADRIGQGSSDLHV